MRDGDKNCCYVFYASSVRDKCLNRKIFAVHVYLGGTSWKQRGKIRRNRRSVFTFEASQNILPTPCQVACHCCREGGRGEGSGTANT
jgi:hypothetical protein